MMIGDKGLLGTEDCWYYRSPVYIRKRITIRRKTFESPLKQKYPLVGQANKYQYKGSQQMDFARGVVEMAEAIAQQRPCRLSARFSLHINEIVLAINNALETGTPHKLTSTFEPIQPMPWAK